MLLIYYLFLQPNQQQWSSEETCSKRQHLVVRLRVRKRNIDAPGSRQSADESTSQVWHVLAYNFDSRTTNVCSLTGQFDAFVWLAVCRVVYKLWHRWTVDSNWSMATVSRQLIDTRWRCWRCSAVGWFCTDCTNCSQTNQRSHLLWPFLRLLPVQSVHTTSVKGCSPNNFSFKLYFVLLNYIIFWTKFRDARQILAPNTVEYGYIIAEMTLCRWRRHSDKTM